jgi:hypothetical protein
MCLTYGPNKLECLPLCKPFKPSVMFAGNSTLKYYTRVEWFARDKHSSLLGPLVIYDENEFGNIVCQWGGPTVTRYTTNREVLLKGKAQYS